MGFTGILLLADLALLVLTVYVTARGIRTKNWKKAVLPIAAFCVVTAVMYFGLLALITSM